MDYKIKVFIGTPLRPAIGNWYTFPMDWHMLNELIDTLPETTIISDYETELGIEIGEYTALRKLNALARKFKSWYECGNLNMWLAAYLLGDGNIDYAEKLLMSGKFEFYDNVANTEQLGEAIVESGRIKVPQELIDLGYIDFEKIGNDWECKGCRIFNHNAAIMQTTGL